MPGDVPGEIRALQQFRARRDCPAHHWSTLDLVSLWCSGFIVGALVLFLTYIWVVAP